MENNYMYPQLTTSGGPIVANVVYPGLSDFFTPQGWQCPRCKRVFAPHVGECLYCNRPPLTYATDGTTSWEEWLEFFKKRSGEDEGDEE